jgi:hypothetical protein
MIPLVLLVTSLTSMAVGGRVSSSYRGPTARRSIDPTRLGEPSSLAAPAIMSCFTVVDVDACILCQVIQIITSSADVPPTPGEPPVSAPPVPHD